MSLSTFLSCLFVVAAGVSVALQQVLNANLRMQISSPWWAGAVSYFVGLVVMLAVAIPSPKPVLTESIQGAGAWFSWIGGLFGAIFIAVVILMIPRLGAATTLALIVVGQMTGTVIFDHFGLFGVQQHSISLPRVVGVACLILGVVLVRR